MSEEEETMSALALAERAVSAAVPGESTIANFEISDQALQRQGAGMVLSSMEKACRRQQYVWPCQSHGAIANVNCVPSKGKSRSGIDGARQPNFPRTSYTTKWTIAHFYLPP